MSKNEIKAEIIADSLSPQGHRLTSFVLTYPRFIHSEMMTHRVFSRNAASSRAIPFKKMVQMVKEDPFIPIAWQKDHKGMQGSEYLHGREEFVIPVPGQDYDIPMSGPQAARELWLRGRDAAVQYASMLNETTGVTKQLCNRMLEPYLWYTAIFTGTEWQNFFALRAEDAAEIHIKDLAYKMLDEYNKSKPKTLKEGEWHIPFGDKFDDERIRNLIAENYPASENPSDYIEQYKVKIATARCARVSYLNFEGKDDYKADVSLHCRLSKMKHMSPFEHCAQVMTEDEYKSNFLKITEGLYDAGDGQGLVKSKPKDEKIIYGVSGNLRGFRQYRKNFKDENRNDNRVKKK